MTHPLTCRECGSSFQRREHYQRHLRTHTKEKPFTCSVCGSSFGRIDSLARHHSSNHADGALRTIPSKPGERLRVSRACKRCSTAKVRCDGQTPCQKCNLLGVQCFYEPPRRRRKAAPPRAVPEQYPDRPEPELVAQGEANPSPLPTLAANNQSMLADAGAFPTGIGGETHPTDCLGYDFFGASRVLGFQNDPSTPSWATEGLDVCLWPASFGLQQEAILFQNITSPDNPLTQGLGQAACIPVAHLPPTPASDITDLYSRSHTPPLDKDAVDIRQYHPTSIEVDALLSCPEIDPQSLPEADFEDFAHVDGPSAEQIEGIIRLTEEIQTKPHYPPFTSFTIPCQPVLNAWVQLYFEYFHPVFPILCKAAFSTSEMHPLLVMTVAAIGAQFSTIKYSAQCARAMRELVRRQASRLVSVAVLPSVCFPTPLTNDMHC